MNAVDYDWLIVGSGFGGSVSALRLAEKGYKVGVLEAGRRYRDEDYAKTTWDLKRFLWAPALGLRGIFRLTPFKDVFIASGAAVGGGSVVYANTLYRASPEFFANPQWAGINDWSAALAPHYDTAEKMLGVQMVPHDSDGQQLLREVGRHFGVEDTFQPHPGRRLLRQARARRCRTRTSAAKGPRAPAARAAAPAWSAVAKARRTRWSRTTCGSRKSAASRFSPSVKSWTSVRSAPRTAPTATR